MASNFGDLSQFDYLYDALTKQYPGLTGDPDGTSVFQFATTPIAASWTTGNDANAYDIANAVPLDLNGFYTPGDALDAAYQDLILSIQPANYSNNPAYAQAQTVLGGLQASFAQTAQNANSAYYEWAADNKNPDGTPMETKTAWLLDPLGGASWQSQITTLQTQIQTESAKLAAIVHSMDGALARAQQAAATDTMPISHGGPAIQVPAVTISGNLGADLARWASYPQGQYDFDVIINQNTVIKYPWKTAYSTSVTQNCWSTNVSVNVNTSRIITDVNYQLEVSAVGVETYKITRGAWYDPDYVSPSVTIAPGTTVTNDTFFGLKGSLHLIPETIFVMYKPTFKLTISTEVYQQQFVANASADIDWINLFGFQFKFDGLASLQPVAGANNTTTVTFASPSDAQPQIIGVVSKVEYNGSTNVVAEDRRMRLLERILPQFLQKTVQPAMLYTVGIGPQNIANFPASGVAQVIEVARYQPLGAAPFVVYNTATHAALGAGSCPALSAHPPYVPVHIPPNVAFTVQNLSPSVSITVSG